MYKIIIIAVGILLLFRLNASCQHAPKAPLKFDGQQVEFSFNDYRMIAGLGADISGAYLVVGGSTGNDGQMGHLAVLPMAVANQFKEKYGDFRRCTNPGANEAQASVINMSVILQDQQAEEDLKEVVAQEKSGSDPIVAIQGSRLNLIKYYYRDEKEPQDAQHFVTNMEFYFIRSLKLNVAD